MARRIVNIDELTLEPRPDAYAAPKDAKRTFDARHVDKAGYWGGE